MVTGRNVARLRLLLNDRIVDLDREITLVLNGQVTKRKLHRSLPLLANAREGLVVLRNDPKYVFVASCDVSLP